MPLQVVETRVAILALTCTRGLLNQMMTMIADNRTILVALQLYEMTTLMADKTTMTVRTTMTTQIMMNNLHHLHVHVHVMTMKDSQHNPEDQGHKSGAATRAHLPVRMGEEMVLHHQEVKDPEGARVDLLKEFHVQVVLAPRVEKHLIVTAAMFLKEVMPLGVMMVSEVPTTPLRVFPFKGLMVMVLVAMMAL